MEILFLWLLHFRIFPWLKLSPSKLVTELQCVEISSIASILRFFRRKKMLLDIKPCPGKCNLEKNMSIRELRRKSVATLLVHRTLWSMASLLITPLEIQTNTTHTWKQDPFLTEIGKKKSLREHSNMEILSASERTERLPCKFRNISVPHNKSVSVSGRAWDCLGGWS